jgi:DNA-binding transcriptional LysR family regulator
LDISLKQLEMFRAVVVAGSITKASRRMGLSQPSISQQLAKFEEMLGTPLLRRNRTGLISLTPAGEFWFRAGDSMLQQMANSVDEHRQRFIDNSVSLHIGVTPTLRGRFVSAAARIAKEEPGFTKFELFYALSSHELVEKLRLHQLNCAIVNVDALAEDRNSFAVADLFQDHIAWVVVPASVSPALVRGALKQQPRSEPLPDCMSHFVDVYSNQQLRAQSEEWYRHNLPGASATFRAMTYAAATDIVAEGLATAHCPMSMLPNLTEQDRAKLQFIPTDIVRSVALVMPKHLLTLTSYSNIYRKLVDFCRDQYREEMRFDGIRLVS